MKKAFISCLALTLFASYGHAQETSPKKSSSFFLRVGGGYAFSHAGQYSLGTIDLEGSRSYALSISGSQIESETNTYDLKKGSLGKGVKAVLAGGVMFHKNLGLELAIGVDVSPQKYTYNYNENRTGFSPTYTYKSTRKNTTYQKGAIHLMPSVVLQTGGEKLNVYSRVGVVLPVAGKIINERKFTEEDSDSPSTYGEETEYEIKTRFTVGIQGALGFQLFLGEKAAFFVEANGVSMNAYAKKATLTKAVANGTDYLPYFTVSGKVTEFENSTSETNVSNPHEPSKAPTFSIPYSNIGLGLGLVFYL